ncbi:AMP-binding protein [Sphingomonas sp. CGMCC 1.13654]|uniref:AMP-binding protein n=1 Tax=Sphingomonas chungangi TaxID=2683589 RepID=A0A838L2W1_9SPHN|nr:AMP-binding protein [Sphingomonas chungangi]MBA2933524.1 AMP-binding protein [Sphingomonas chungangi]MVW54857.1 AMP-binding protein [Sphingomonas chungangi]
MNDPSFGTVLKARGSSERAGAIALRYADDAISWGELDRRSDARAGQLLALGVAPNELVAISLPNGVAHHIWSFAAWKAGATPCVLPTRLPGHELQQMVDLAAPRILVRATGDAIDGVSVIGADQSAPTVPPPPRGLTADNWKAIGSGGSTGRPKLIVDHGPPRLTARIEGLIRLVEMPSGGVMLNAGPLHHNAGFLFTTLGLLAGSEVVGMERFDPEQWLALVERHRVEWAFLVPTMMHRIWSLPAEVRDRYDLSSLRKIVHMAAACPIWLKQAWIDWLGPERILEGYAGTEGPGTMITGEEWLGKPGSVGRVPPDTISIRNAAGAPCPPGEIGEIFFPPGAADRFHYIGAEMKLDAERRMSLGDLGHIDEDGYLFLADRRSDMIVRGGVNIYPAEIEAVLSEHPAVTGAVVIGLPCDELGHRVHALIEPRPATTVSPEELDAFSRVRLSAYKCPESYEQVADALRDEAGKVRRGALRDERLHWLSIGRPFAIAPKRMNS